MSRAGSSWRSLYLHTYSSTQRGNIEAHMYARMLARGSCPPDDQHDPRGSISHMHPTNSGIYSR